MNKIPIDLIFEISTNLDNKDLFSFMLINKRISNIKNLNNTTINFFNQRKELGKLENILKKLCYSDPRFNEFYILKEFYGTKDKWLDLYFNVKWLDLHSNAIGGSEKLNDVFSSTLYKIIYTIVQIYKFKKYDDKTIKSTKRIFTYLRRYLRRYWMYNIGTIIEIEGFGNVEIKDLNDL